MSARVAIRNAVLGSDRGFSVIDGGGGGGDGPPPIRSDDDDDCPVIALGDNDGLCYFLDPIGQKRRLTARELGQKQTLVTLFRGEEDWLRKRFPERKEIDDGAGNKEMRIVGFRVQAAASEMIRRACSKGLFGVNTTFRQPGIWRADDGMPVIHCGDGVLIRDRWADPGTRTGNIIWAAAEAAPRPGPPCDHSVAVRIQEDLQTYWNWTNPAGGIVVIGQLYCGYLCGALDWRYNAFVIGSTGSGKSALQRVFRAAWPMHMYTSDASKAGIEQALDGKAMPALIEEANDRNKTAGLDLIDIVLSAGGQDGTKLTRGTADGKGRNGEILSSVVMFAINPPDLQPQHMNRFMMLEVTRPISGRDHKFEHSQLIAYVRKHAAGLWGRAISSFERYNACLGLFREVLRERGCSPREMDGKTALLAGWFVMTHEGLPTDRQLREGVAALGSFIVDSKQAEADDGPRRALGHLMSKLVALHRSTDTDPIGTLLDIAFGNGEETSDERRQPSAAANLLGNYGMRPIRACRQPPRRPDVPHCPCDRCWDPRLRKPVPRGSEKDGVWIANRNPELERLFLNSAYDAGRWRSELGRLPGAVPSGRNIRIGGGSPGNALWLDRETLFPEDDDDAEP